MREEIGKFFVDSAKLVFGGVVLGTILKLENFSSTAILISGIYATIILALIGFYLLKKKKTK